MSEPGATPVPVNQPRAIRVLLVGLAADAVDFAKWPQLTREALEAAFARVLVDLTSRGYDPAWCLTDTGATAGATLRASLERSDPDLVLVGAGVRTDPDHLLLFETIVNLVHEHAPRARIVFNTIPHDSVEAVDRWAGRLRSR